MNFDVPRQKELASDIIINLDSVRRPRYGRFLEEFVPGTVFYHPRGLTITADFAQSFASSFMQANPLYLNAEYAQTLGFGGLVVSPMMALNVALSLGVQNDSEQAIAHLGYYHVQFPRPAIAGDTLRSQTEVLSRRLRGTDGKGRPKPGIVRVRTQAFNQRGEIVVSFERAILIPMDDMSKVGDQDPEIREEDVFPEQLPTNLPEVTPHTMHWLTGENSYFEDFTVGEIILHSNGRTITDEHIPWTYRLGNTHPLHYDRIYSSGRSGPMSGEPIVYGGLVFAWLEGLASRDTGENALWDLGYTEGYHTQPAVSGDTLYAISRVLAKDDALAKLGAGILTLQLIGVKNISSVEAVDRYGSSLFQKESNKPRDGRIPEKLFEIERRLLVKMRSAWRS